MSASVVDVLRRLERTISLAMVEAMGARGKRGKLPGLCDALDVVRVELKLLGEKGANEPASHGRTEKQ